VRGTSVQIVVTQRIRALHEVKAGLGYQDEGEQLILVM
jgi:hypothetical protein